MLDDHQTGVRRDNQAFRRDQPVSDVPRVLVQEGDGWHQLTYQTQGGVDVELNPRLVRDTQDIRQARAFDMVGNDRQTGGGQLDAVHAADTRVVGVAEIGQARRAFAQRKFEGRHGGERRTNPQDLQQFAGCTIGGDDAIADAVTKQRSFRSLVGHGYRGHGATPGAATDAPAL